MAAAAQDAIRVIDERARRSAPPLRPENAINLGACVGLAALAVLVIACGVALPASAQSLPSGGACGAFQMSTLSTTATAGSVASVTGNIFNQGNLSASANLTASLSDPSWPSPQVSPSVLPVAAKSGASFSVTVNVPSSATGSPTLTVVAHVACAAGPIPIPVANQTVTAQSTITTQAAANPVEGALATILPFAPAIAAIILLVVILGGGAAFMRSRRRGLAVQTPEPLKSVGPGRGASFPLVLENRSTHQDVARFDLGTVPEGWSAFTALPEVTLVPAERRTVWVMVRAPADARDGTRVPVTVNVRSETYPQQVETRTVTAEVRAGEETKPATAGVPP